MVVQTEPVETKVEIEVDQSSARKAIGEVQKFARDTGEAIDQNRLVRLQVNLASLRLGLSDARKELRLYKKQGDRDAAIQAQLKVDSLSSQVTEANRRLNNFRNTGDEATSRLQAKFNGLTDTITAQGEALRSAFRGDFVGAINGLGAAFGTATVAGKAFLVVIGPIALALGAVAAAFSTFGPIARAFESSFAGVRKTLDGTEKQFSTLRGELENLSTELPLAFEELAGIAEIGGQLGVPIENVSEFTRTVAQLGIATGLSAEEISLSFARIASVTNTPLEALDNLGASLTALGNNFAAREGEILEFTNRIAGAGNVVGISAQELFAISTAFTAVGIQAEAGGTAVSTALLEINNAVNSGGQALQGFAQVAGVTAQEFAQNFQEDAAGAFLQFVEGVADQGDNASNTLQDLLGGGVRLERAFLSLAGNTELLADALVTANTEFERNTALTDEVAKRLETTDSQLRILGNRFRIVGADIGQSINEQVLPVLQRVTDFLLVTLPNATKVAGLSIQTGFRATVLSVRIAFQSLGLFVTNIFNGVINTVTSSVNGAIGLINSAIRQIQNIPGLEDIGEIGEISAPTIDTSGLTSSINSARSEIDILTNATADSIRRIGQAQDEVADQARSQETVSLLNSVASELDDVADAYKPIGTAAGRAARQQEEAAEDVFQKESELLKERQDLYEEGFSAVSETVKDNLEDINSEIEDSISEIRKIQNEIQNISSGASEDLASRFVEVKEELEAVNSEISEEGITNELEERRRALEEELALVKENTTEEQRLEAIRQEGLSETEKILEARDEELLKQQELLETEQARFVELAKQRELQLQASNFLKEQEIQNARDVTTQTIAEINKRVAAYERLRQAAATASANVLSNSTVNNNINVNNNIANAIDANTVVNDILSGVQ